MVICAFSKYSGCGNDFILVNNRDGDAPIDQPTLIQRLCDRRKGIGADGVILFESSLSCDGKMRIFNADGQEAEMCGNGLRCLAHFMLEIGFSKKSYTIETMHHQLAIDYHNDQIKTTMSDPTDLNDNLVLEIEGTSVLVHYLDTGVPHAVRFVDSLEKAPILSQGRQIRFHTKFAPKGTNATFVQILSSEKIAVRTYERGVEGETLACGTGAAAAAIIGAMQHHLTPPLEVLTRSGEVLIIDFNINAAKIITHVTQTGPAVKHFSGVFEF